MTKSNYKKNIIKKEIIEKKDNLIEDNSVKNAMKDNAIENISELNKDIKEKEAKTVEKEINEVFDIIKKQQFKVYSIISDKAVIAKGLEDNQWYSKVNNNYVIGQIIN